MTAHLPGRQPGSDLASAIPSEPDSSSRDEGVLMATHLKMSAEEGADRLAIRELLFDAYAHCADLQRRRQGQMALFTPDTRFLVYMDSCFEQPTQELHGWSRAAPVFVNPNTYQVTTASPPAEYRGPRRRPGDRRVVLHRSSPVRSRRSAHPDDRVHPLPGPVRQAVRRARGCSPSAS